MDSAKLLRKLIRHISVRGTIPRGAPSRVAEYLGASKQTVWRWFFEDSLPAPYYRAKIEELLREKNMDFSARKTGPREVFSKS